MSETTAEEGNDPRIDRLYLRLPAIHRMHDAEQGWPLRALLRVIAEQVNAIEDGIARQYGNWFIETAEDWVVPYIGDLVGYAPVAEAGPLPDTPGEANEALARVLVPRREVGNTIRHRRRKGTLALLEELARDVAAWPALAVEYYRLLGWQQNIKHPHPERAGLANIRAMAALDRLGGPFDRITHSVDVRAIASPHTRGLHNIPSVGMWLWRLGAYSVTRMPPHCVEEAGPHCFTFSLLGQDAPLFTRPLPQPPGGPLAAELARPVPIRRLSFEAAPALFLGTGRSLAIWTDGFSQFDPTRPLPPSAIIAADLTDWRYLPPLNKVAVDPVLGRLVFPPAQMPRRGVRVSYQYGFSAAMGGGEYPRELAEPSARQLRLGDELVASVPKTYRVGRGQAHARLADAIAAWAADKPWDAVIELTESAVFVEPIVLDVPARASLTLRAASGARPVIRLLDWQTDLPDSLTISMGPASRVALDGLLVTGRGIAVSGSGEAAMAGTPDCAARLLIRHCTLVPGWGIGPDCTPNRMTEPSLSLSGVRAAVAIEHSILGAILVREDEVGAEPVAISLSDSILDANGHSQQALGALDGAPAHAVLTVLRCTVFGVVQAHAVALAENSIFNDCVHVARRQSGCMRYCYVPAGCRTPRRHRCQPDLAVAAAQETVKGAAARAALVATERLRVAPAFSAIRYGRPDYAQLADACAPEIRRGADDESEMGAFHNLYQPQREASLLARLAENIPAGMQAGLLHAT